MRHSYFTRHPDPERRPNGAKKVHVSQDLDTGALCGWDYLYGASDPKLTTVPDTLHKLLAEVTCSHCIKELLLYETLPREDKITRVG